MDKLNNVAEKECHLKDSSSSIERAAFKVSNTAKRQWYHNGTLVVLTILIPVAIFFFGYYLLVLAGVYPTYFGLDLLRSPGDGKTPRSIDGNIVAAAVTFAGGLIALLTFLFNHDQKERQHDSQLESTQILEDKKRDQEKQFEVDRERREREFENAREKRDRDLAELQRIESEFASLVQELSSHDSLKRLNSVIGLGEIARVPDPRRVSLGRDLPDIDEDHYESQRLFIDKNGGIQHSSLTWPVEWKTIKTERNYPYFLKAASRLLVAIRLWEDEECKVQAIACLNSLADWCKADSTDEPLLHDLANLTADCLRRSWLALANQVKEDGLSAIELMHVLRAGGIQTRYLKTLPAHLTEADQVAFVISEFATSLINAEVQSRSEANDFSADKPVSFVMNQKHVLIVRLFWIYMNTSDLLGFVLANLGTPPECLLINSSTLESNADNFAFFTDAVSKRRNLKLSRLKLFAFRSFGLNLQFADAFRTQFYACNLLKSDFSFGCLDRTRFLGSYCEASRLRHCRCFGIHVDFSDFRGSLLQQGEFSFANFSEAILYEANFDGAHGTRPVFRGSHFGTEVRGCIMTNTRFIAPDFRSSEFGLSNLSGSRLAGAYFGTSEDDFTDIGTSNWETADFEYYGYRPGTQGLVALGEYDTKLWNHLDSLTPVLEEESKRIPPWEEPGAPPD